MLPSPPPKEHLKGTATAPNSKMLEQYRSMSKSERAEWLRELLINNSLYIFLIAAIIVIQAVSPRFLSGPSIVNIISLSAVRIIGEKLI